MNKNSNHVKRVPLMMTFALIMTTLVIMTLNSPVLAKAIEYSKVDHDGSPVFYAYSGDQEKIGLMFIHGTPGGWTAFHRYLSDSVLQKDFFMVSLDRPGWGNSILPAEEIDGNFATQSSAMGKIFERFPQKKWILVGHSLGASIAPQVALDHNDAVAGLGLLAGSLSPKLGRPRWYNRAASTWLVSRFIGEHMRFSNREIMSLRGELSKMDTEIKNSKLASNVIILQGAKDRLVSPKNPKYAYENWSDNFNSLKVITIEDAGHFLPWRQTQAVVNLIYELGSLAGKQPNSEQSTSE